ncbi:MAG: hypothetical protein ACKOKE_01425 [Actinomycetota bacterium]
MRKGMALGLAGIVAASLVGAIALLGGRVDAAQAGATTEPQVITEHRTITKYRTETVAPEVIVVASPASSSVEDDDAQGEDASSEEPESTESSPAESEATSSPSPVEGSDSGSSSDDHASLDGHGESHDD